MRRFLNIRYITVVFTTILCLLFAMPLIPSETPSAHASSSDAAVFLQTLESSHPGTVEVFDITDQPLTNNSAPGFWFYDQLNENERRVYQAYYLLGNHIDRSNLRATVVFDGKLNRTQMIEVYFRAYYAMVYDHPELYLARDTLATLDRYLFDASVYDTENSGIVFYLDGDRSELNRRAQMMREQGIAVEEFLWGIDRSQHPAVVALQLHDNLMYLATYDDDVINNPDYDRTRQLYDIFVSDAYGTPHTAVCQGYALAYQYLLQMCGIKAVYIVGQTYGNADYPDSSHAWVAMEIEGQWYESDPTWDDGRHDAVYKWIDDYYRDGDYSTAQFYESMTQSLFFDRYTHVYHMRTSDDMLYSASWCWESDPTYTLYYSDGRYSWVTMTWEDTHVRDDVGPYDGLAYPIATGTYYNYYHVRDEM